MIFRETKFASAWLIEAEPIVDERGWFMRTFCRDTFHRYGLKVDFAQSNHSQCQRAGILRGLHYQLQPAAEAKLVRCIRGQVFDVIVDVRHGAATFLQWYGVLLSASNRLSLYVPEGFAHGFQAVEDESEVIYHSTANYAPHLEQRIRFDDPSLGIAWPIEKAILSPKDDATSWLSRDFDGIEL